MQLKRRIILGTLVAVTAAAVAAPTAFAARSATRRCHSHGHVLLNRHNVLVWTTPSNGDVFICAARSYKTRRLTTGASGAAVSRAQFNGHYVGFFLTTNEEVYWRYLIVFSRKRGRVEVKDLVSCQGNDECGDGSPVLQRFWLTRNGWVAEEWNGLAGTAGEALLATNGVQHHYQLDLGNLSHISLSHGTLAWTSDVGGASSVTLGPAVITPSQPGTDSACQVLIPGDVTPVLGANSSSSSPGECTYTSSAHSGWSLTVKLQTGMSTAQSNAAQNALNNDSWMQPGTYEIVGWPGDVDFSDWSNTSGSGTPTVQFAAFVNGAEVEMTLSLPGASSGQITEGTAQVGHLTTVALDRLFGVPVNRAQ